MANPLHVTKLREGSAIWNDFAAGQAYPWQADLAQADLSGCDLRSAVLQSAVLVEADLSKADLRNANLQRAKIDGANLRGANLQSADLLGAKCEGADFRYAHLERANLRRANLWQAQLEGANLSEADLSSANLQKTNLSGKNLAGCNLEGANLKAADLSGANLQDAILRQADLRRTNLANANLRNAELAGANVQGADLDGANIEGTTLDEDSKIFKVPQSLRISRVEPNSNLMRIRGIGESYGNLLETAGVDSAAILANRTKESLYAEMLEANAKQKIVRRLPPIEEVGSWIARAQQLEDWEPARDVRLEYWRFELDFGPRAYLTSLSQLLADLDILIGASSFIAAAEQSWIDNEHALATEDLAVLPVIDFGDTREAEVVMMTYRNPVEIVVAMIGGSALVLKALIDFAAGKPARDFQRLEAAQLAVKVSEQLEGSGWQLPAGHTAGILERAEIVEARYRIAAAAIVVSAAEAPAD